MTNGICDELACGEQDVIERSGREAGGEGIDEEGPRGGARRGVAGELEAEVKLVFQWDLLSC